MAFNPFDSFRKNSKIWFAGLAILCMLTFVLSSGLRGDAFDQILSWFGAGSKQGKHVATLYGDKLYEEDIREVRAQRGLANEFMLNLFAVQEAKLREKILRLVGKKDQQLWSDRLDLMRRFDRELIRRRFITEMIEIAQKTKNFRTPELSLYEAYRGGRLREHAIASKKGQELEESAVAYTNLMNGGFYDWQMSWQRIAVQGPEPRFFGDGPIWGDYDSTLDFVVWKKQADELGIKVADKDIRATVNQILGGVLFTGSTSSDRALVREALQKSNFTESDLDQVYDALRVELRVGLAKEAILGTREGQGFRQLATTRVRPDAARKGGGGLLDSVRSGVTLLTPTEYFKYYRENRNTVSVSILPIKVESFIDKSEKPESEDELKKLFNRYKNVEPSPTRARPAFKEPHKMRIEWVGGVPINQDYKYSEICDYLPMTGILTELDEVTADDFMKPKAEWPKFYPVEKWYHAQARIRQLSMIASMNPTSWYILGNAAEQLGYQSLVRSDPGFDNVGARAAGLLHDPTLSIVTASMSQDPTAVATFVTMPAIAGINSSLATLATSQAAPTILAKKIEKDSPLNPFEHASIENRNRAPLHASLVAGSLTPGLSKLGGWLAAIDHRDSNKYIAWGALRKQVMEPVLPSQARELYAQKLSMLQKDLADLSGEDEETKQTRGRELIKKFLEDANLTAYHGQGNEEVNRYGVDDAEGLEPIREAYSVTQQSGDLASQLFSDEFKKLDVFRTESFSGQRGTNFGQLVYWKTVDRPAKAPKTLSEVREKVLEAWRLQQARQRALKHAQKFALKVAGKTPKEVIQLMNDERVAHPDWNNVVELDQIAQKLPPTPGARSLENYTFPVGTIKHPLGNLVSRLTELDEKETLVVPDLPGKNYYVCYIKAKSQRKPKEMVVGEDLDSEGGKPTRFLPTLRSEIENRERRERVIRIMRELRRQASELDPQGRYKLHIDRKDAGVLQNS